MLIGGQRDNSSVDVSVYDCMKSKVFRRWHKIVSDCADVPSSSTFQTLGPATVKALQAANIVRFTMYFRSEFMEISKPSHFWKAWNTRNLRNNVYICAEIRVAAILDFKNGRRKKKDCPASPLLNGIQTQFKIVFLCLLAQQIHLWYFQICSSDVTFIFGQLLPKKGAQIQNSDSASEVLCISN